MSSSKLKYLFGANEWQYPSDEYLNYVTPQSIADIVVSEAARQYNLGNKVMWDMFSGIGTDAIRFSKSTGKIVCSELDNDTYQCMNANMDISNIYNVSTYNEDCCKASHKADIIYFDPPWGNNYVSGTPFSFDNMRLGDCTVAELMRKMHAQYDMIIKTPYLCDSVDNMVNCQDVLSILTFSQQKIKFYFLKKMSK